MLSILGGLNLKSMGIIAVLVVALYWVYSVYSKMDDLRGKIETQLTEIHELDKKVMELKADYEFVAGELQKCNISNEALIKSIDVQNQSINDLEILVEKSNTNYSMLNIRYKTNLRKYREWVKKSKGGNYDSVTRYGNNNIDKLRAGDCEAMRNLNKLIRNKSMGGKK